LSIALNGLKFSTSSMIRVSPPLGTEFITNGRANRLTVPVW
jgi:hypothetical protein